MTRRFDPYAAARRAGHIERSRVDRVALAAESAIYEAVEQSSAAQRAAARKQWQHEETIYQDLLKRRDEQMPQRPLHEVEAAVAQDALAYAEIAKSLNLIPSNRPFTKDALAEIAKRELKKTRNGVVRQGHAFIVKPEAIKTFIGTFRAAEKSLRKELSTQVAQSQEVAEHEVKRTPVAPKKAIAPRRYEIARFGFTWGM